MTIEEALKVEDIDIRVSSGSRWLYWEENNEWYVVLEKKYGQRGVTYIGQYVELSDALDALLEG